MIQLQEMPTEGQFVAVWIYDDDVWSDTYQIQNGEIFEYNVELDAFIESVGPPTTRTDVIYIISGDIQ